jgi:hypothetical protein
MTRRLTVVQELQSLLSEESDEAPLPEKSQCLYVEPLPNGERKNCKNCALWVTSARCLIHEPSIHIGPDWVCGYWVGGKPLDSDFHLQIKNYIPRSLTGLTVAKEGTACDNCKWFDREKGEEKGHCEALQEQGKPAAVEARGCCSRWDG